MLEIQKAAKEIYSKTPKSFYFFCGPEYGVKVKYLTQLQSLCLDIQECDSFETIIKRYSQKSLFDVKRSLKVVRYDKGFISRLNVDYANKFKSLKFSDIVVGIFDDTKDESILDKYFPDNTIRFNSLIPSVMLKHLQEEFSDISEIYLKEIVDVSSDYYQARIRCLDLSFLSKTQLCSLSRDEIQILFGCKYESSLERFKLSIASRNFSSIVKEIDNYEGDLSLLFYEILNVLLEIVKIIEKPYTDSPIKQYVKLWSIKSVKIMFDEVYSQIFILRTNPSYDIYNSLIYLSGLLMFRID